MFCRKTNLTLLIVSALALCAYAAEVEKETKSEVEPAIGKDKRQTQGEYTHLGYRIARKQVRLYSLTK